MSGLPRRLYAPIVGKVKVKLECVHVRARVDRVPPERGKPEAGPTEPTACLPYDKRSNFTPVVVTMECAVTGRPGV